MTNETPNRHQQSGASLIVGLILLLVLSVLAISTMSGASLELVMAGNTQYGQNAFQMAETGVDRAVGNGTANLTTDPANLVLVPATPVVEPVSGRQVGTYASVTQYQGWTNPPIGSGYSLGTNISACHFQTRADGTSARNSADRHVQEFYVMRPCAP